MAKSHLLITVLSLVISPTKAVNFVNFDDVCDISSKLTIEGVETSCGGDYPIDDVPDSAPVVEFSNKELESEVQNKYYLILMVDPDAPSSSNPTCRSWLHWIKKDVSGSDLINGGNSGTKVVDYNPPTPPSGSGFHRYITFAFEQPSSAVNLEGVPSGRCGFSVSDFISANNLKNPVAVNMYRTQNE